MEKEKVFKEKHQGEIENRVNIETFQGEDSFYI